MNECMIVSMVLYDEDVMNDCMNGVGVCAHARPGVCGGGQWVNEWKKEWMNGCAMCTNARPLVEEGNNEYKYEWKYECINVQV